MVKHIGNCPERRNIFNPREMVYAKKWEMVNQRTPGLNRGCGYLELLLNQHGDSSFVISSISQRDAFVAATVIQWLGTNIGQGFMEECEKKIKEEKSKYRAAQVAAIRLKG